MYPNEQEEARIAAREEREAIRRAWFQYAIDLRRGIIHKLIDSGCPPGEVVAHAEKIERYVLPFVFDDPQPVPDPPR